MIDLGPTVSFMEQSRKKAIELEKQMLSAGSGRGTDRARLKSLEMEEGAIDARATMMQRALELQNLKTSGGDAGDFMTNKVLKPPSVGAPGLGTENADLRKSGGLLPSLGVGVGQSLGLGGGNGRTSLTQDGGPGGLGPAPGDDLSGRSDLDLNDGLTDIFGPTGYSRVGDPLGPVEADESGKGAGTDAAGRGLSLSAVPGEQVGLRTDTACRELGIDNPDSAEPPRLPPAWPGSDGNA